ncbi:hypothetical protein sos41_20230 [Alphaproteobacteria bacterium SO-S41]|nr:hypothetical protein sos41_20230 [Alphaproteobacteria bacterium SO-S41]
MSVDRGPAQALKYRAFISYRHKDKLWGDWLHKALESYRVPRELVGTPGKDGPIPQRIAPVFRDREDLAASVDLGTDIRNAIAASANLVVICSPGAVASKFVADEIIEFKRLGRSDRIFAIIVEGEPNAADPALECFPDALKFHLAPDGTLSTNRTEPIAADAREHADGKENAKLKLIAGLLGVGFDQLRRRELEAQRRRFRRFISVAATLVVIFAGLAGAAVWFGYRAEAERVRAEDNLDKARKTANGVVSDLAGEFRDAAGMQASLGRKILDRAKLLMDELGSQGEMTEARLRDRGKALGMLGRAVLDIGQIAPAETSLKESLRIWENVLALHSGDATAISEAAKAEHYLSWSAAARGDLAEERRLATKARDRVAPLVAAPDGTIDPIVLAEALEIAVVLDPAVTSADRAAKLTRLIALREDMALKDDKGDAAIRLTANYRFASQAASAGGDLAKALEFDNKGIALAEKLVAADPYDMRRQGNLASQYMGSAVEAFQRSEVILTKSRLKQAIDILERLIAIDPTNGQYRQLAASSLAMVNAIANLEGDTPGQEDSLQRVITTWRGLVQVDPRNVEARVELAGSLGQLANFYDGADRVPEQIAVLREQLKETEDTVALASNPETLAAEVDALIDLAYAVQSQDYTSEEAMQLLDRAEAILKPLLAASPEDHNLTGLQTLIETLRTLIGAHRNAAKEAEKTKEN